MNLIYSWVKVKKCLEGLVRVEPDTPQPEVEKYHEGLVRVEPDALIARLK